MPQFCVIHRINTAAQTLATLCEDIRREGIQCDENSLAQSFQWRQSAQLALAVLRSLQCYVENGGGSRGARAIYDGEAVLHRKHQVGHSWPGVFGQKIRMPGNI